jgi:cyanate permease
MNGIKTCRLWFPPHQLGLANGLISMGMALGFLIGSLVSATWLSPWLGGWRNVLVLYGAMGAVFCLPWLFSRTDPQNHPSTPDGRNTSIRQAIGHVIGLKNIWLLGLTFFCVGGCVQAVLGYLPIYLRAVGWEPFRADSALTGFHTISMIFVLPIAIWSDRSGSRRNLLFLAVAVIVVGSGLLGIARGGWVWAAVLMTGLVRDGFMALLTTMTVETDTVGPAYAGSAVGLVVAIGGIGSFLAPPLGNALARFAPGLPFIFWSGLALLGFVGLYFAKERPAKVVLQAASSFD